MKLPPSYYLNNDVRDIARDLLGKVLCVDNGKTRIAGIISETEAYNGVHDRACHAYGGRRTSRTEVMYGKGGRAYVYLCYGIHYLFNVVTNLAEIPDAVLIRAVFPVEGVMIVKRRRKGKLFQDGPGKVCSAFGIGPDLNGESLSGKKIWIEDRHLVSAEKKISVGPRIGVESAGADAGLPYRFLYNDVSEFHQEVESD